MIDPDLGYWIGRADQIHGLTALALRCGALADARLTDAAWLRQMRTACAKPYYANVLSADDVLVCREIMAFAHGQEMMAALRPYYDGATPSLSHIGIFASGYEGWRWRLTQRGYRGTQTAHFDVGDPKHVKLFCFLTPVGARGGPLTVWPATSSAPFNQGHARVRERALQAVPSLTITGPRLTTALVDTSRCIHYGSRTRGGRRIALVIHYCTDARRYSTRRSAMYEDLNVAEMG